MKDKKKVMIIAHFCDYGQENSNNRFNYLANVLSDHGYEVELVTSSFSHRDKVQRTEVKDGSWKYKVTLIYEPSYRKNISLKRLFISHRTMAQNLRKYLKQCDCPDVVYCAIPSINVAEVALEYAVAHNIPFVVDVQDLWPEAYRLILKNEGLYHLATGTMKKRVDKVYRAADQIVAVSETYAKRAKRVNKKCDDPLTIFIGTSAVEFDKNLSNNRAVYTKPADEVWVGYCGTLGHSYDLPLVMRAISDLKDDGVNNIRLLVIGSGPLEQQFKEKAKLLDIKCTFTGTLAYPQMCAQLCECDIVVNPIVKDSAASIINKHADYAMVGRPVINTQVSPEYRALIEKYHCGINCNPDSEQQVAEAIRFLSQNEEERSLMGKQSRRMADEKFSREETYKKIADRIQEII